MLARCGPFDKIGFWSHSMSFIDHLSLVSRESIFRKCTNFSDFCLFWKTFSDDNSQKPEQQNDSWEWWNVSFTPAIRSNKKQVHEWLFDQFFVNCNLKTLSKKWEKSLKLMHLHENVSLDTTLWLFQKCIKRLEKTFLSNGPHLGSPQYA